MTEVTLADQIACVEREIVRRRTLKLEGWRLQRPNQMEAVLATLQRVEAYSARFVDHAAGCSIFKKPGFNSDECNCGAIIP